MSHSGSKGYRFSWNRSNLVALMVLCAVSTGLLAYRVLSRPVELRSSIPVHPDRAGIATEAVDPNTASAASLRRLPGIGPEMAQRIVDYRQGHPGRAFGSIDDLTKVKGIGPLTTQRIGPYLKTPGPGPATSGAGR